MNIFKIICVAIVGLISLVDFGYRFGANPGALPNIVANYSDSLAAQMATTDTTATLTSGQDTLSRNLKGLYCFTIDAQTASSEFTCGNASGTSLTSLTRGIDPLNWNTTSSLLIFIHRRGASVTITDYTSIGAITRLLNGSDTFSNILSYDVAAPTSTIGNSIYNFASVGYANGVASSGAANAATTVKGIVQLSTAAQTASGTALGSTGASLVVPTLLFSSTSSVSGNVPVIGLNNFLSTNFFNTSTAYTWAATSTFASSTFLNGTTTIQTGDLRVTVSSTFSGATSTFSGGFSVASTSLSTITFKASGDDTTTGAAYQGIANISSTAMTIGAHRVLLIFTGDVRNGAASNNNFDFQMDGTRVSGAAGGLTQLDIITAEANQRYPLSMSFLTSVATSGVHTFGVQWKTSANTLTVDGASPAYTFSAIELPISQ